MKQASMKLLVILPFLLTVQLYAKVDGAIIQSVKVDGPEVTVTVLNQSEKPIESLSYDVHAHFKDGHEMGAGSSSTGALLQPHQVKVEKQTIGSWQDPPTKVEAVVTFIIYADGIAETDNEDQLDEMISMNDRSAKTTKLLVELLKASLSDAYPLPSARGQLESLIAQKDPTLDDVALQTVYGNIVHAPEGKELDTLKEQAKHYSEQWMGIRNRPRTRRANDSRATYD